MPPPVTPTRVAGGCQFSLAIRQSSSFWLGFRNLFSGGADAVVEGHTDASKPPIRRFGRSNRSTDSDGEKVKSGDRHIRSAAALARLFCVVQDGGGKSRLHRRCVSRSNL